MLNMSEQMSVYVLQTVSMPHKPKIAQKYNGDHVVVKAENKVNYVSHLTVSVHVKKPTLATFGIIQQ